MDIDRKMETNKQALLGIIMLLFVASVGITGCTSGSMIPSPTIQKKLLPTETVTKTIPLPTSTVTPPSEGVTLPFLNAKNLEVVSQIGGVTKDIAIQGDYAYMGKGPRLIILDVSNMASPIEVGQSQILSGVVHAIAVSENYAYITTFSFTSQQVDLWILDISDPDHIKESGHLETMWTTGVVDVEIKGDYFYVATMATLGVIDISDASQPKRLGDLYVGQGGDRNISGITVSEEYVYVTAKRAGLRIIDVSTPSNMLEIGFLEIQRDDWGFGGWMDDVIVNEQYAFVSSSFDGLLVIDLSSISKPKVVSSLELNGAALDVELIGKYAYVAVAYGGQLQESYLSVVDISNPLKPSVVWNSMLVSESYWTKLASEGTRVCILDEKYGLLLYNASEPQNPELENVYEIYKTLGISTDVVVRDGFAYVAEKVSYGLNNTGALRIVDISDPSHPIEKGFYITIEKANSIAISGNYAYVAIGEGLEVVDISTPSNPKGVGSLYTDGEAIDVVVVGSLAYVSTAENDVPFTEKGLHVIDVSTPDEPAELSFVGLPGMTTSGWGDITIVGNHLYLTDYSIWMLDISSPSSPIILGELQNLVATNITIDGEYAYFGSDYGEVTIMEISTPSELNEIAHLSCKRMGSDGLPLCPLVTDIKSAENLLYIVDLATLRIVEISNPSNPIDVAFSKTLGRTEKVEVNGDYIYLPSGNAGLFIFHFTNKFIALQENVSDEDSWPDKTQDVQYTPHQTDKPPQTSLPFSCPGLLTPRLRINEYAYVNPEPPMPNLVRLAPDTDRAAVGQIPPGEIMEVLYGPECAEGFTWWKVRAIDTGIVGWTVEGDNVSYWLVPCETKTSCGSQ